MVVWLVGGGGETADSGLLIACETVARCPVTGDAVPYAHNSGVVDASVKAFVRVPERAPNEDDFAPYAAAHNDTAMA